MDKLKIMAVDLGDARTGLAFSDATCMITGEAFTVSEWNREKLLAAVSEAALSRGVTRIIVGNPKNMNDSEGVRSEKSAVFAEALENMCGIETVLWDERSSTVTASRILSDSGKKRAKQRAKVDAVAASVILQSYLDYLRLHPGA